MLYSIVLVSALYQRDLHLLLMIDYHMPRCDFLSAYPDWASLSLLNLYMLCFFTKFWKILIIISSHPFVLHFLSSPFILVTLYFITNTSFDSVHRY